MISHSNRFIFIHVPKTGGTSISAVLKPFGIVLSGDQNVKSIYYKHAKASYLQPLLGDEYSEYFKFAVVRNPFDWLISNYEFNRGLHRPFLKGTCIKNSNKIPNWATNIGFENWLYWWVENFSPSQNQFIADHTGIIIIDKVLRFESLEVDFSQVCEKIGVDFPKSGLPHLRVSYRPQSIFNYYNNSTSAYVIEKFSADFDMFGYSKKVPQGMEGA